MLTYTQYREILIEFPDLQDELKKNIFKYYDKLKRFMVKSIQKIEYFKDIGDDALHDIIYNLNGENFNKGDILQKPGEDATSLFFLQAGVIEITIETEGHEFVIEKLFRGSIINYRTFFLEEHGEVYYKFGRSSMLFSLPYDKLEELLTKHKTLKKKFNKFKQQTIMQQKPFPLDYIMELPRHL